MTQMTTEDRLDADKWVDKLDTETAIEVMLDNQAEGIAALRTALPQITAAAQALHTRLASSDAGRLAYIGAGTSARIGVQDGAELLPTFGWPDRRTAFIIAGVRLPFCSLLKMQKIMNRPFGQIFRAFHLVQMIVLLGWLPAAAPPIPAQASAQHGMQAA